MRYLVNDKHPKWRLYGPQNSMDTNYHLVNKKTGADLLIDIHDVWDPLEGEPSEPGDDEEPWLPWPVLRDLADISRIKEFVWLKK